MKKYALLSLALIVAVSAFGCGDSGDASDSVAALPSGDPDIRGGIESISSTGTGAAKDIVASIFVVGLPGVQAAYDRASVSITGRTRIFEKAPGADPVPADTLALRVGGQVEVWFTGPVAESYPVQAIADMIYIVSKQEAAADIFQVKDRHTQELMAVPGVVGVGIGGTPEDMRIVVYLDNASPELRARIPAALEGYQVVTEVTGTITPL